MEFLGKFLGRFKEHTHPFPKAPPVASIGSEVAIKKYPDVTPITAELLDELVHSNEPPFYRKFVRQDKIIALSNNDYTHHRHIVSKMHMGVPDDAGKILVDPNKERLIVEGESMTLEIDHDNPNRPATIELLRAIAPGIKILGEDDEELT